MYRDILVPLDGTAFGEHALPAALAVARRTGARLHLVHVHLHEGALGLDMASAPDGFTRDVVVQRERGYLEQALARASAAGVDVDARMLDGPVARTLAEQARGAHVDLVVLATHAHTGLSRLWHRGVAHYLTRHLTVPVLLVHAPQGGVNLGAEPRFRRVLLPLGGSAYSEQVLDHAVEFGRAFGARYTLLKVVAPPIHIGYTLLGQEGQVDHFQLDRLRDEALEYLDHVAARLRHRGLEADTDVAASNRAADAIARYVSDSAGDDRVDLVAMETHGMGGFAHVLDSGVVEEVVHESSVPVLVHHAHLTEPADADADSYEDAPHMGWPERRQPDAAAAE